MRALIDAHMLGAHETGNETYIRGLLDGLAQIGSRQVVGVADPCIAVPGHDAHPLAHRSNTARLLLDLPRMARQVGASLIHGTYVAPPFSPVPTVLTVHDVSFARYPEAFTVRDRALLGTAVPFSARRARAIIVPSVLDAMACGARRAHGRRRTVRRARQARGRKICFVASAGWRSR